MTRPDSTSLTILAWIAWVTIGIGGLVWMLAVVAFSSSSGYGPDDGALGGMAFGGAVIGFGLLTLVGYLVAAAIGDALIGTLQRSEELRADRELGTLGRSVGDGVDADPHPDRADSD